MAENSHEKDIRDLRHEVDEVKEDVHNVSKEVALVKHDVTDIKLNVTNHIPTQLRDLSSRLEPFEKRYLKFSGIQEFLSGLVKITIAAATITWTVIKVLGALSVL